ncbi:hypothetical protein ACLMJK_003039 [Lecanora helva]
MDQHEGRSRDPQEELEVNTLVHKPLKKKKSLTRLFSSSKKPLRSTSPSPENAQSLPATPKQAPSWPLVSETSPRIPSMRFESFMTQEGKHEQFQSKFQENQLGSESVSKLPNGQAGTPARFKPIVRNFSEPVGRKSIEPNRNKAASTLSNSHIQQEEKPTIHHAPTFPGSQKPSKTGLRMPSSSTSLPRDRDNLGKAPYQKLKSSVVEPQLSRPATAGGESASKPTGKRKPSVKTAGLQGALPFSTFDDNDLPSVPQPPWQAEYSNDEVRSSFRSALTTSSSHVDTTSTERSSVVTKGTSINESTLDGHSRPGSKTGGMTVDDAIDMYAAGFADDDEPSVGASRDTSISEEDRRRSIRIAEAINDNIGGIIAPSRPATGESISSHTVAPTDAPSSEPVMPPSITPITTNRDQYGFHKASHHISVQQYDAWNRNYQPDQERRTKKWEAFMRDERLPTSSPIKFPGRSTKTERFIRKGIPPAWRGPAWFFYAGGDAYLKRHAQLYPYLVSRSEAKLSESDKEAIERDINRTFPDNIHFKPDATKLSSSPAPEPPILTALRRVLRAFAYHSPRIGYCQSLNFLTGLLLLFLPEEKAFWMLHIITTVYLPGTHEVSLEGANVDLWVLMIALKSTMPSVWTKVGAAGTPADGLDSSARLPPISLCTTSWFMSLFIGTLPIESVLRVWDVLFYEGSRTLFRVALTIFKLGEQRIKMVGDSMELFQVVQSLPRGMLDASSLINAVCRRGAVSAGWIEARRWERREWYSRERAGALVSVDEGVRNEYFAPHGAASDQKSGVERLKRGESMWKRRRRKGSAPEKKGSSPRLQLEGTGSIPPSPIDDNVSTERRKLLAI